jgi:hypothetical protein
MHSIFRSPGGSNGEHALDFLNGCTGAGNGEHAPELVDGGGLALGLALAGTGQGGEAKNEVIS